MGRKSSRYAEADDAAAASSDCILKRRSQISFTASQISPLRPFWHCSLTARASPEVLGEGDDQPSAHSGDREAGHGNNRPRLTIIRQVRGQLIIAFWPDVHHGGSLEVAQQALTDQPAAGPGVPPLLADGCKSHCHPGRASGDETSNGALLPTRKPLSNNPAPARDV
jgi:hypothetical protein